MREDLSPDEFKINHLLKRLASQTRDHEDELMTKEVQNQALLQLLHECQGKITALEEEVASLKTPTEESPPED